MSSSHPTARSGCSPTTPTAATNRPQETIGFSGFPRCDRHRPYFQRTTWTFAVGGTVSTCFGRVSQPGAGRGVLDRMPTPLPPPPGIAETDSDSWSRRTFLAASAVGSAVAVAGPSLLGAEPTAVAADPAAAAHGSRV